MSNQPIRFAVLGLGMGMQHCRDLVDAEGCELVAICDAVPERLEKNRQEFGVRAYASYDDLLRDSDVDVVSIATPSGTHADLTVQALKAGKHVVCEKPPDVTVEAVDRMIAAKRESGKQVMVIFQSRFQPVYEELKRTIDTGGLGKLAGVHGEVNWWRSDEYYGGPGGWKGTWKLDGGGSLANQGIHVLDMMQHMAGPVAEVYARFGVFAHSIESEDKTVAVLTFKNGALGTLSTTTAAYPGLDRTLFIHGSSGSVLLEDDYVMRWAVKAADQEAEREREREMIERYGKKGGHDVTTASDPFAFTWRGHLAQFQAMAKALQAGETVPASVETTRHTIEILNAIYASGRTGQAVRLGE
jgi:UDP-N-acetyl-2-amino-2-deoxyglucuronate dehydrogenase